MELWTKAWAKAWAVPSLAHSLLRLYFSSSVIPHSTFCVRRRQECHTSITHSALANASACVGGLCVCDRPGWGPATYNGFWTKLLDSDPNGHTVLLPRRGAESDRRAEEG